MADRLYLLLVFSTLLVGAGVIHQQRNERYISDNLSISISENREKITLTAEYPANRAASVHQYISDHFGLTDLTELGAVEVKNYHTPDKSMHFYIKSRNGYLKIVMNRKSNTIEAYDKIRQAAEGLKKVLAGS
jgi:fructosamine-3-kinase